VKEAIPALREALDSRDFFLCGKSMVALARLGDRQSIPEVERLVATTRNPRLIIHGATALEMFRSASSVGILIPKLQERLSGFIRDEINLALAGLLGLQDFYYSLYLAFLEDKRRGVAALKDYLSERLARGEKTRVDPEALQALAEDTLGDETAFGEVVSGVFRKIRLEVGGENVAPLLIDAACKPSLARLSRFRYLLAAIAIRSAFEGPPQPAGSTPGSGRGQDQGPANG
jgi:hypothetical protein